MGFSYSSKLGDGTGIGDDGFSYNPVTDTLDVSTLTANNVVVTALATPTVTSVTPTLTQVGTINVVAGASLADGDYFTVDYGSGTIPIEFDATPGNGTTGGRIPFVFAPGDAAGTIRDGLIALINLAAPTKVVASIGGAAAITVSMVTPGEAGGVITENVANAGFTVVGFANPTAATTYGYKAVSYLADGTSTAASAEVTTAAGHATLSASNYVTVVFAPSAGSVSTRLYRTTGGTAPPKLLYTGTATSFVDSGQAGTAQTPATGNTTGVVTAATSVISGMATSLNVFENAVGNIAVGSNAFRRACAGSSNVAIGGGALAGSMNASGATAVGNSALYFGNATGLTAIGFSAGYAPGGLNVNANTTGTNNTYLGSGTGANSSTQRTNTTTVGYYALSSADNQVVLGNTNVTEVQFGTGGVARSTGAGNTTLASNGSLARTGYTTELLTLSTAGASTVTAGNLVPATARIVSIAYRITTDIATATAFTVKPTGGSVFANSGTATTSQTTLTAGTTGVLVPVLHADGYSSTANTLTVDTTGTPSAGVIRFTVFYEQTVAGGT